MAGLDDTFVEGNAVLGEATMFVAGFAEDPEAPSTVLQSWWRQPNEPDPNTQISSAFGVAAVGDGSDDVAVAFSSFAAGVGSRLQGLDDTGAVVWDRPISPSPFDRISDLAASNGRLYAAGVALGPLAGPAIGEFDRLLMEIDVASGDSRWETRFGSPGVDDLTALAVADGGDILVAGWTTDVVVAGNPKAENSTFALSFSMTGKRHAGWQQAASGVHDFVDALPVVPASRRSGIDRRQCGGRARWPARAWPQRCHRHRGAAASVRCDFRRRFRARCRAVRRASTITARGISISTRAIAVTPRCQAVQTLPRVDDLCPLRPHAAPGIIKRFRGSWLERIALDLAKELASGLSMLASDVRRPASRRRDVLVQANAAAAFRTCSADAPHFVRHATA